MQLDRPQTRSYSVSDQATLHSERTWERLMPAQTPIRDETLRRIRGEYLEMPGLRLTTAQAQRLWNLDRSTCEQALGKLVASRFLSQTRDGSFIRAN